MNNSDTYDLEPIAIISMNGRFPGAKNITEFWQNLCNGKESLSTFTDKELIASGVEPALLNHPKYVKAGMVLEDTDMFDASFFGYSPREAKLMDPQHRLFLECAWELFESAGYNPEAYDGKIGVFAGSGMNTYLLRTLLSNPEFIKSLYDYEIPISNDKDFVATKVSYKLNLRGPGVSIGTACSTSLVAVHFACQSLLNYQSDMALAGGVTVQVPQKKGYLYHEGGIPSPDGHCRAFDANAQGTVVGSGVGMVLLKRLEDALADGDMIYAVIRSTAINNDGSLKVGYTAPSVDGQAEVIAEAQAMADIPPETITYIEAHGTGTSLGDPIEIAALTRAFRAGTQEKNFCAIGSVKTNVGHLDAAAGVTGLIKTALALKHKMIPPSLNFENPNPEIDFDNSPFYVNTTLSEWKTDGTTPRRAGVSSFGIGGTNAHAILEEFVGSADLPHDLENRAANHEAIPQILILSAKTAEALETATTNLSDYLKNHSEGQPQGVAPTLNLPDVAYTLQIGRKEFAHRRMAVCRDIQDAETLFSSLNPKQVFTGFQESETTRQIVFMFSGQGSQYENMGSELYQRYPVFREQVDQCFELLKHATASLNRHGFAQPALPQNPVGFFKSEEINQTALAQPALFVIEYALAKLWMSWGIRPHAMIGHSIGEYVAACLAGVFSLEDALSLVAARGQMMQEMPKGDMLSVLLPEEEILETLRVFKTLRVSSQLDLSAINSPSMSVVSGNTESIAAFQEQLMQKGIQCRNLHTSHAFHSAMMEPVLMPFSDLVRQVRMNPPQIPYISNLTGTWIRPEEATDPDYWTKHLRHTVRFADGLQEIFKEPGKGNPLWLPILLEVGPGRTLSTFAMQHPNKRPEHPVLTSLRHPKESISDQKFLLTTLGKLWLAGVSIGWEKLHDNEKRYRVSLPTYPFERKCYWIESSDKQSPKINKNSNISDWFYVPSWKRTPRPVYNAKLCSPESEALLCKNSDPWLVFMDEFGIGEQLVKYLKQADQKVVTVTQGSIFSKSENNDYTLNPELPDDYESLLNELRSPEMMPKRIVHLWSVETECQDSFLTNSDFYSILFLAQALGKHVGSNLRLEPTEEIQISVISGGVQDVIGRESIRPEKATLLGALKVIPQEYPNIRCQNIDVILPSSKSEYQRLTDCLFAELIHSYLRSSENLAGLVKFDPVVAYRGNYRWVQDFEPIRLEESKAELWTPLKPKGVYLITGGLGNIGLLIAEYLAKTVKARLILIGRSAFPTKEGVRSSALESQKIQKIEELKEMGAEILIIQADVANETRMREVIAQAEAEFGKIDGVIHAAGITGETAFQSVRETDKAYCERHFRPKIQGLRVLREIFGECRNSILAQECQNGILAQKREPDFFLLMSSLSSVLGGLGFAAYSAANIFMDTVAQQQNRKSPGKWISINWDAWGTGDTEKTPLIPRQSSVLDILPHEGISVFERVLKYNFSTPQIVISTGDLQARLNQWIKLDSLQKDMDSGPRPESPRPGLQSAYAEPRNEIEQTISEMWQTLLGIEQVGIHDNFFELGGHSLLAVQIISRIHETFQVELSVQTLFDTPTVAEIAEIIEKDRKPVRDDLENIADMLDLVEQLSEDEIKAILDKESDTPSIVTDSETIKAVFDQTLPPDQIKEKTREFYNAVTRQLNATEFGEYAKFLNFGYIADETPQYSVIRDLPKHTLNPNSVRLILELIGDCDLTGKRILDVGCGRGGNIEAMATYFRPSEIIGMDLSSEAISFCKSRYAYHNVSFSEGDAEHLPFRANRFDVVTNIESSHSYPNITDFYTSVWRVLKPGGYFLYTDILSCDQMENYVKVLQEIGFLLDLNRDITSNVLLSCDETAKQHLAAFDQENTFELMADFLGLPGSKPYEAMKSRASEYRIFRFRKK